MKPENKSFSPGAILTITSGQRLCPMDELYEILSWMTGDKIYTHHIPSAMKSCAPVLRVLFPKIASVPIPSSFGDEKEAKKYIGELNKVHGTREIPRLHDESLHDTVLKSIIKSARLQAKDEEAFKTGRSSLNMEKDITSTYSQYVAAMISDGKMREMDQNLYFLLQPLVQRILEREIMPSLVGESFNGSEPPWW